MQNDQNDTQGSTAQDVDVQKELQDLMADMQALSQEVDTVNIETEKSMNDIHEEVKASVGNLEQAYSDLDNIETEVNEELDAIDLVQAETIAGDAE